jgi:hypothetical protein
MVGAMAWIVGAVAMTARIPASSPCTGDGACTKVAELCELALQGRALSSPKKSHAPALGRASVALSGSVNWP